MTAKNDSEVPYVAYACGVFTIVLLFIGIFYSNLGGMFSGSSLWMGLLLIGLVAFLCYSWYKVIRFFNDPNYNYWRFIVIVVAIAASILILAHRNSWLMDKEFKATVEQNKGV